MKIMPVLVAFVGASGAIFWSTGFARDAPRFVTDPLMMGHLMPQGGMSAIYQSRYLKLAPDLPVGEMRWNRHIRRTGEQRRQGR